MNGLLLWFWRLPLPDWLRLMLTMVGNSHFVVTASAVVLNEDGEVLLFKHTYRGGEPWGLPGGFVKRDEDPGATIEREIREESGLEVCAEHPLRVDRDSSLPCISIIYAARFSGGAFRSSPEVCEARYFPIDRLPKLSPGVVRYIHLARARREDHGPLRSG